MSIQLFVLKDFVRGSSGFGVFLPKKKKPKSDNVQTDSVEGERVEQEEKK